MNAMMTEVNKNFHYVERIRNEIETQIRAETDFRMAQELVKSGSVADLDYWGEKYKISLSPEQASKLFWNSMRMNAPQENLKWAVENLLDLNGDSGNPDGSPILFAPFLDGRWNFPAIGQSRGVNVTRLMEMLKELGAKWNDARNKHGSTLMHVISENTYGSTESVIEIEMEMVRFLLDNDADPNCVDSKGKTPMQVTLSECLACLILEHPRTEPEHRKLHNLVVINKNNFKKARIYDYCDERGAIEKARSRLEKMYINKDIEEVQNGLNANQTVAPKVRKL